MMFLDPKVDFVFKKLFGIETHKNILISFLNSVLGRSGNDVIVNVIFNDPANLPEIQEAKASIVDVCCTDKTGNKYIVEMQVSEQKYYASRATYYASVVYGKQLKKKGLYESLMPVIFVGVLDYVLFPHNTNYISHHYILDSQTHERNFKDLEFHIIELPKFKKELEQLETILDKWIYFLQQAGDLDQVPASFKKEPDLFEAFNVLAEGNWTENEFLTYHRYLDIERSTVARQQWLEEKIEEGLKEGILQGAYKEKLEIAKQLLDVLDTQTIAKKTGLSITVIENLKKNSN